MRVPAVGAALAVALACGLADTFVCDDDAECKDGGIAGVCQPGGHCSFPDDGCASGQRFGDYVGGGLAGECVPEDGELTGGASATSIGSASSLDGTHGGVVSTFEATSADASSASTDPDETTSNGLDESDGTAGETETTGGPEPLDPDLVLWLTFDDPRDPFGDHSMYARDVACDMAASGCPAVLADGGMGSVAEFDGINDAFQVSHDPALETDEGLTIAVRVRNDALTDLNIHTVMARPYDVATENSWELFFRDDDADLLNDVVFEIADPGGQIQLLADAPVPKGEWVRVVAVWSPSMLALYLDGVLQTSAASTGMLLDDNPVVVAGDVDNLLPTHWFVGALDDVRVYRRVLSDDEIAALD